MDYMTKYDYLSILSTFDNRRSRIYYTLQSNEDYVSTIIYNNIIEKVAGASELFLNNKDLFIQWFTSYPLKNQDVSILDAELIGFLDRCKEFSEIYKGDLDNVRHIMHFLVLSWSNKTKSLKQNLDKFQMIYHRYIKFLMSEKGQDFLYGKSYDLIPDFDPDMSTEDTPFYETQAEKHKILGTFKKKCLSRCCESSLENIEMAAIWDVTFSGEKFTYIKCAALVRKLITEKAVSRTNLYYHLKRLRVKMMQYILNEYDKYLDDEVFMDSRGQLVHLKEKLQEFLAESIYDLESAKYSCNKNQLTNTKIAETVANWCSTKGIRYKYGSGKVLIKLKMNADGLIKKSWKLFVFKGGGWFCQSTRQTGFITDLVPKNFFFKEEPVVLKKS